MFRQENSNLLTSKPNGPQANGKKHDRQLYASIAGLVVVVVVLAALFIPQGAGSPLELSLNYKLAYLALQIPKATIQH